MIHYEDDIEDDYDVLDHGIFSEAEEDNDIEKPSNRSGGEDNGEEQDGKKKKKVAKTGAPRRVSQNPKPKLNADRLCGPRGIMAVQETFKNVNLKGKGHEKADLDIILSKMEHWAHRLFPQLPFDDCVEQVAKVGSNRTVQVYLKRFRSDMIDKSNDVDDEPVDLNDAPPSPPQQSGEQLFNQLMSNICNTSTSSVLISQEQQARMAENKRRAEEKRKSRLLNASLEANNSVADSSLMLSEAAPLGEGSTYSDVNLEHTSHADIANTASVHSPEKVNHKPQPPEPPKHGDEELVGIDDMLDDLGE